MDYEKKKIEKLEHEVIDYERGIGYSVSLDDVINKLNEVIGVLNGEPELRESEDERIRKCVTEIVKCFAWRDGFEPVTKEKCLAWLEKQKEQKPVEWSEEDEKNIYFLTRLIELYIKDGRYETGDGTVTKPEIIKMLKSLRPSWKPSEEQMTKLHAVAYGCPDKYDEKILFSLYNDLKKLKGDEK